MLSGLEIALRGIREDAIVDACLRYMGDEVEGHDIRFAPSMPQIVREAKNRQSLIGCIEEAANRTPLILTPPETVISEEERERMKPRIQELWKQFKVQMMPVETEKVEYVSNPEREAKLAAILEARQSDESQSLIQERKP